MGIEDEKGWGVEHSSETVEVLQSKKSTGLPEGSRTQAYELKVEINSLVEILE